MLDPPSLDSIVKHLSTFLMAPFFFFFLNHFLPCWIYGSTSPLLEPRNYSTLLESKNYSIKEQLKKILEPRDYSILLELWLEPRNYSASLESMSYSIFVGFVSGTRELLNFTRIKDLLNIAGIKDLL